jgi:hypothetical protein
MKLEFPFDGTMARVTYFSKRPPRIEVRHRAANGTLTWEIKREKSDDWYILRKLARDTWNNLNSHEQMARCRRNYGD